MQSRAKIERGHRYRQVTGGSGVWIVVGFTTDHAGNPHAQLMAEKDRTRIITIACAALQDRKVYERLAENSETQDEIGDETVGYAGLEPGQSS